MKYILSLLVVGFVTNLNAQKKILDSSTYDIWKKIENQTISNDGRYVAYEINPHRGDGWLFIHNMVNQTVDSFPRGTNPEFSRENNYMVFKIKPGFDTLRNCELNKIDKKKWPKDTLAIYLLEKDSLIKLADYKKHELAEKNNWLVYYSNDNHTSIQTPEPHLNWCQRRKLKKKPTVEDKIHKDAVRLVLTNPSNGSFREYLNVMNHKLSESGKYLTLVRGVNDSLRMQIIDLENYSLHAVGNPSRAFEQLSYSSNEMYFSFISSLDSTKQKNFQLHIYNMTNHQPTTLIYPTDTTFTVSEHQALVFDDQNKYLYFGIKHRLAPEQKDSLIDSEKVKLDLWHYADKRTQPQQLKELRRDEKEKYLCLYHLDNGQMVKLGSDTLQVSAEQHLKGNYLYGSSNERYALAYQWDMSGNEDHYKISVETGHPELIAEGLAKLELSPKGEQTVWFNVDDHNWYHKNLTTQKTTCITCQEEKIMWQTDINGMPMDAPPVGFHGWSKDEANLYLSSEFDFWEYKIETNALVNLSKTLGQDCNTKLTPHLWEKDSVYLDFTNLYFLGQNQDTKGSSVLTFDKNGKLQELTSVDAMLFSPMKSMHSDKVLFRKQTVTQYPDLYFGDLSWKAALKLSNANPQQQDYNWSTVELIKWTNYEGLELEGLVYKPEDFDPSKSYPLLVYYYELYSDRLHGHYVPKPTASIIYPTEYASGGYIVFIPDIRYEEGHPAKSAYSSIMSGTDYLLKYIPSIDSTRMGLQGQSWGGYQTAQMITMTNRYAAAMAGAPVSNMFSAYGGMRWGSGLNRQFQYEKTQSRIGKTIWEAPELYIENSPLFHLPKVETPLLIMHNDGDGAVPWYQGVELYNGLRRLQKPCWLLNYNDDDHNLMRDANRRDLSIRMRQFFDYYLMDKAAPEWLIDGIPAKDKGKNLHYDLKSEE